MIMNPCPDCSLRKTPLCIPEECPCRKVKRLDEEIIREHEEKRRERENGKQK